MPFRDHGFDGVVLIIDDLYFLASDFDHAPWLPSGDDDVASFDFPGRDNPEQAVKSSEYKIVAVNELALFHVVRLVFAASGFYSDPARYGQLATTGLHPSKHAR